MEQNNAVLKGNMTELRESGMLKKVPVHAHAWHEHCLCAFVHACMFVCLYACE